MGGLAYLQVYPDLERKINNQFKKLPCNDLDTKKAEIKSETDKTTVKFRFKSNKGNKEKFIGVVVK